MLEPLIYWHFSFASIFSIFAATYPLGTVSSAIFVSSTFCWIPIWFLSSSMAEMRAFRIVVYCTFSLNTRSKWSLACKLNGPVTVELDMKRLLNSNYRWRDKSSTFANKKNAKRWPTDSFTSLRAFVVRWSNLNNGCAESGSILPQCCALLALALLFHFYFLFQESCGVHWVVVFLLFSSIRQPTSLQSHHSSDMDSALIPVQSSHQILPVLHCHDAIGFLQYQTNRCGGGVKANNATMVTHWFA